MPISTLIDPSNRLLGWSTNDLSLYGGQPTVAIGAPAGISDDALTSQPGSDVGDAARPTEAHEAVAAVMPDASHSISEGDAGAAPAALSSAQLSNGSTPAAFDEPATPADTASAAALTAPATGISAPQTMSLASEAPSHSDVGAGSPLPADAGASNSIVAPLTSPLAHFSDPLTAQVAHVADGLSTITTTLGSALAPIESALDGLHDSGLLPSVLDHGSVIGLGGSDPVAGIVTLTSMLDSVDAFAVAPEGGSSALFASTGPVLDLLTDDAPHALLGDLAHHDVGLFTTDHHDGGLGLL